MFDVDELIAECRAALAESSPAVAVREVLERAVSRPSEIEATLGASDYAQLTPLYCSDDLTVTKVIWAPAMRIPPHDHRMWAVIGIYGGAEDNEFFRRTPAGHRRTGDAGENDPGGHGPGLHETAGHGPGIVASGGRSLTERDTLVLGDAAIHAVANPAAHSYTGALHVYGGAFMTQPRTLWDPESFDPEPADGPRMQALFEAANLPG